MCGRFHAADEKSVLCFHPMEGGRWRGRRTQITRASFYETKMFLKQQQEEEGDEGEVRIQLPVFPVPFPSPSSERPISGASLPSIKCQADHIDAPPSPRQSLI